MEYKNIRIAVSGIYDYAFEELPSLRLPLPGKGAPEWVEEKRIYKVYRPAETLRKACDKFKMLPLTHHHPQAPVDEQNFRNLTIGYTGENPFIDYIKEKDEVGIRSNVMLCDQEAIDSYNRGEIQLSPGYVADFEWRKGTDPHGNEYDIVMKEITDVNHLALLPAGRGGSYAVVLDEAPKRKSIFVIVKNKSVEDKVYQIGEISEKTGLQKTAEGWKPLKHETQTNKSETEKKRVFGVEYKGFYEKEAIEKLLKEKQGYIQNAFNRKDIGNIDVVYGKITDTKKHKGYGLVHILDKHPDITPDIINSIIKNGKLEHTYNGYNLIYNNYIVGINKGYKENGKYVTTDNWIVTSFKKGKKVINDTIAYAATFTSNTIRSENPFTSEIIIDNVPKVKSIFERVQGTVFDRYRK